MVRKILAFLMVGLIAFTLGTMSSLNAEGESKDDVRFKEISLKLDQVLKNQAEILKSIKMIRNRV